MKPEAFLPCLLLYVILWTQPCSSADKPGADFHKEAPATSRAHATSDKAGGASAPQTECTRAQLWALACPALLTINNRHRHDILWCIDATPENITEEKRALAEYWDVNSREDLLRVLSWIISSGHRAQFESMSRLSENEAALQDMRSKLSPSDARTMEAQIAIARENAPLLGFKSLLGWDYCRYIALCRWGTLCSYISQEEAWSKIMPAAQLLQNSFTSWSDLGKNYLIGRKFWKPEELRQKSFEQNYELLLSDPKSPWNTIPWKTDLSTRKDH